MDFITHKEHASGCAIAAMAAPFVTLVSFLAFRGAALARRAASLQMPGAAASHHVLSTSPAHDPVFVCILFLLPTTIISPLRPHPNPLTRTVPQNLHTGSGVEA